MFKCQVCEATVGPKVHANKIVVYTRAAQYHNEFYREDEWGNKEKHEVDSQGHEIVRELLACPECAEVGQPSVSGAAPLARAGFYEKVAEPMRVKLVACVIDSLLDNLHGNSQGSKRTAEQTVPLVKQFVDENKGLVF